jgi:hypothetical protein
MIYTHTKLYLHPYALYMEIVVYLVSGVMVVHIVMLGEQLSRRSTACRVLSSAVCLEKGRL